MWIETIIEYYSASNRTATIKETKCSQEGRETESFIHCWQEYQVGQLFYKSIWNLKKKRQKNTTKHVLLSQSEIFTVTLYTKTSNGNHANIVPQVND